MNAVQHTIPFVFDSLPLTGKLYEQKNEMKYNNKIYSAVELANARNKSFNFKCHFKI
jgi:hypothetical protein